MSLCCVLALFLSKNSLRRIASRGPATETVSIVCIWDRAGQLALAMVAKLGSKGVLGGLETPGMLCLGGRAHNPATTAMHRCKSHAELQHMHHTVPQQCAHTCEQCAMASRELARGTENG